MTRASARAMVPALIVTVMGASVATRQLPPGYVDPSSGARCRRQGHRHRPTEVRDDLGHRVRRRGRPAARVGAQRRLAANRPVGELHADDGLGARRRMKEEFDRKPGLNPASWKYGIGWIDGPLQQEPHQVFIVNERPRLAHGWTDRAPGGVGARSRGDLPARHVAEPARLSQGGAAARRQSPSDVAMGARRNGTRRPRGASRRRSPSSRSPSTGKFRVDATINKEHMLQRIHTWVADPGARRHELRARVHQRQLRRSRQRHQVPDRVALASGLGRQLRRAGRERRPQRVRRNAEEHQGEHCPGPVAVPEAVRQAPRSRFASRRASWPTASICSAAERTTAWRSSSEDFIAVFEAPLNEARSLAVIEEIVRLIPDKPIRWVDQLASALRSRRRTARLHAHRRDDRHARHELRLLRA